MGISQGLRGVYHPKELLLEAIPKLLCVKIRASNFLVLALSYMACEGDLFFLFQSKGVSNLFSQPDGPEESIDRG